MDSRLLYDLVMCETDIDGALRRFSGDESLYTSCLYAFLEDTAMKELEEAIALRAWDDAFTAAHALKGLAGNMGFVPLFHAAGELVILIRAGRLQQLGDSFAQVKRCYAQISTAVRQSAVAQAGKESGHEQSLG